MSALSDWVERQNRRLAGTDHSRYPDPGTPAWEEYKRRRVLRSKLGKERADRQMREIWRERWDHENRQRVIRGQDPLPYPAYMREPGELEIVEAEAPPESDCTAPEQESRPVFYPTPEIGRTPAERRRIKRLRDRA